MKKFLVVLVVLAFVGLSSMAFAADVSVGGSLQLRSRDFNTLNAYKDSPGSPVNQVDTQERIIINVNAKAGDDVKGKISLWQDFYDWGSNGFDKNMGTGFGSSTAGVAALTFGFREAWISFNMPGIPVNVTGGHQLLQLGDGWFLRSMHFGSEAWVVANVTGNNTFAVADIKVAEGSTAISSDDVDAYAIIDVLKINDNNTVGINLDNGHLGTGNDLYNLGLNYAGKLGPVALKVQADLQSGTNKAVAAGAPQPKYKGNEIVIKGNVPMDVVTWNFLLAMGSGKKSTDTSPDVKGFVTFQDIDPHYTFLYEYILGTAAGSGLKNTAFSNTTAISVGGMYAAAKSLNLGLDVYFLQATEKTNVTLTGAGAGSPSSDIGTEVDAKIYWKLYDNLSWNWDLGYFKPGAAYKDVNGHGDDAVTGIQGILSFNF